MGLYVYEYKVKDDRYRYEGRELSAIFYAVRACVARCDPSLPYTFACQASCCCTPHHICQNCHLRVISLTQNLPNVQNANMTCQYKCQNGITIAV
ncbi:hypothetical protein J6590_009683 [Homalodisca vitripennis]|nr:hypothetical protein J6590_009683 [Homalodisca vitripennis]